MPDVSSRKFVEVFQRALSSSGRITESDVSALKKAQGSITNVTERAAAESILAMLRNDREFDSFEVVHTKKALGVLLGQSTGRLPKDLERVLRHSVPEANVAVKDYALTFDVAGAGPAFPAKAAITLDKKAGKDVILEINPERLDIKTVTANGEKVPFEVKDGRLHVTAPGATQIDVGYTVKPAEANGPAKEAYGLIRDKYTGRMWTLTWPYNTGALFPSNSAPRDGATARVTVKVGAGAEAVGTGTRQADGSFKTNAQAPAYAVAFYTAKDFTLGDGGKSHDGVEVTGFGNGDKVPQKIRDAYLKTATRALDFYAQWLGKYDYGDTLKVVEVSGGLGGMEHTAAVAIMMNAAKDPEASRETAAHETAHHWFGDNLRIKDWGDFWMSEGFTNYATYRYFRAEEGEPKFMSLLDRAKLELRDSLEANPHVLSAPPDTDVNEIFDSVPYEMGPWMLRMVEVQLGTPKFDGMLKEWYRTHRQTEVSTDEFVKFVKAKTGEDFGPFFASWNKLTAVPSYQSDVQLAGNKVAVKLSASTPVPDAIKIPLRLEGAGGKSITVMVDPKKGLTVDAGFPVKKFTWDPERTVLAFVR